MKVSAYMFDHVQFNMLSWPGRGAGLVVVGHLALAGMASGRSAR
jgi:hypothetical protein